MPAASSMVACSSSRILAVPSSGLESRARSCSRRRTSSAIWAPMTAGGAGAVAAYSAAARPARAPNTRHSGKEFEPSRLAPLMLTHAVSPAA